MRRNFQEISQRTCLWHSHFSLHHACAKPEESLVAFGADDSKGLVIHTTFIEDAGEFLLCLLEFGTSLHTFHLQQTLLNQFGTTCLNCKISLSKCYLWLTRIAILRYKITCIAGEHNVFDSAFCARTKVNHFADVSKMVCY